MFQIFIGYDPRQPLSYNVLQHSIIKHAKRPVSITPLKIEHMPEGTRTGLTPFTYSRFLVPYLCGYKGKALFLDADILARGDVTELDDIDLTDCDVAAVDTGASTPKLTFERAAVMLFNNERCQHLTPEYVAKADTLHGLGWAQRFYPLEPRWNHLVGYWDKNPNATLVHFTQGMPCYPETKDCEFAAEWIACFTESISILSWKELMGHSVHAQPVYERLAKSA